MTAHGTQRRDLDILSASSDRFLRFGFRKTSMDDVARAAGLSRQGLYLRFPTKEALFDATIDHLIDQAAEAVRRELGRDGHALEDRLTAAFAALADIHTDHLDELLEVAAARREGAPPALEQSIIAEFATALAESLPEDVPAADRSARILYATSHGLKRLTSSPEEYVDLMRHAVHLMSDRRTPAGDRP
ncbi:TetR family transcriptional regulator [Acrocarpospora corrugata]|uniref:TetR family transcriptional regulator n=1 Tax=Acrocarpospora corrugata TaxID=35763 RepID=A0A5M3VVT1_9ACTN|nr:TetR/AcrR family transcriptional regulator [Acrocarpospora corrugata]GES00915.1 TetR family transcriptional regulator [Acrocarpospora corrugata]